MQTKIALTCVLLSACSSTNVAPPSAAVARDMVPAGFTAAECKLVDDPNTSGKFANVADAMDAGAHRQQRAECHHRETLLPATSTCRDDSGNDLPAERCAAQK